MRFSETEQNGKLEWLIRKDGCMHCAEPGCLKARPSAGAIIQYANGIVDFQQENCIGCGYCIAGVRLTSRASIKRITGFINAPCAWIGSASAEPACVKTVLPARSTSVRRKRCWRWPRSGWLLKTRLCQRRIYNPPGVGGTHVMYVLHHADQPELYHKLPKEPQIDTSISLWKGR